MNNPMRPDRSRTPRAALALGATLALLGAGPARGQDEDRFREIEAGFEDLGPLAESQRFRPVDLRTPVGFDRVYEIVGADGLLARRAGAVTAVFDRSHYLGGFLPVIPPGAVFYLGDLPVDLQRPGLLASLRRVGAGDNRAPAEAPNRVPTLARGGPVPTSAPGRLDLRVRADADRSPRGQSAEASIWTDDSHRRARVRSLIRRAAEAGSGAGSGD
jgi:hypothetical protein